MTQWAGAAVVAAVLLLATACRVPQTDTFVIAEQALLHNDLLAALQAFDAVPVAHPRYPEARAAAAGVERCMRRSQESLLEGLLLRSEWRDQEALLALQRAKEIWPSLHGVNVLIQATEHRLGLFAGQDAASAALGGSAVVPTLVPSPPVVVDAVPDLGAVPEPVAVAAAAVPAATEPAATTDEPRIDPVAAGLVGVEARLGRGELEAAVTDLFSLAARHPEDLRVRLRLVRVLHQRALLRYGQGALPAAIADWERVLELEPGHAVASSLLNAARAELAVSPAPKPAPAGR